jgi:hypothetical protein
LADILGLRLSAISRKGRPSFSEEKEAKRLLFSVA